MLVKLTIQDLLCRHSVFPPLPKEPQEDEREKNVSKLNGNKHYNKKIMKIFKKD